MGVGTNTHATAYVLSVIQKRSGLMVNISNK